MSIRTLFQKDTTPLAEKTAQEMINVDEVNDRLLYTSDKMMYGFIRIRADGDSLSSVDNKAFSYDQVTIALAPENDPWQLVSVPHVLDTHQLLEHLVTLKKGTTQDNRLKLLDGEVAEVQRMAEVGIREPVLYLKLWEKEGKGTETKFNKRIEELRGRLSGITGFHVDRLENYEIAYLCKQFAELGKPLFEEKGNNHSYELSGLEEDTTNYASEISLLNEITPVGGIRIESSCLTIGATQARVMGVIGYPKKLSFNWATDLLNNTNAITSILFEPESTNVLADALSRSVAQSNAEAQLTRNRRQQRTHLREMETADELIEKVDGDQQPMGTFTILTMPFADTKEQLEEVCGDTIATYRKKRLKLKIAGQLQKEGLLALLPYGQSSPYIKQQFGRLLPIHSIVGGSPFAVDFLRDPKGMVFAHTNSGNLVSLDPWARSAGRTNSNFVLFGQPGAGKSSTAKSLLQSEVMRGTKILIIDPQSEYHDLCRHLGGTIINMSGGKAIVNILEVSLPTASFDDYKSEEEFNAFLDSSKYDEFLKTNVLATHIQKILGIFRTYFKDATEVEMSLLNTALLETYNRKGMVWESDYTTFKPEDYPIIEDLFAVVSEQRTLDTVYDTLYHRLEPMAIGTGKFMFNGHTNIDTSAQITCLDTMELQQMDDNIKSAQFLNILQFAWRKMIENRNERVMVIVDEAYTMIDATNPTPMRFLRDIAKQCRKFMGALGVISHDIIDLLHENIRIFGQAIISTATYKYFMGTDGKNLQETQEMYNLTYEQVDVLRKKVQGDTIAFIGSMVYYLKIYLPQYKLENMGTAGGV